jgi:magnesium chelatase subunit D
LARVSTEAALKERGEAQLVLAQKALALIAVDPAGLGGICITGAHSAVTQGLSMALKSALPPTTPWLKMPAAIADDRLLGGLDLTKTLALGQPCFRQGLLADADGGMLVVPMAERMESATAARLCAVLDEGQLRVAREGFVRVVPTRIAILAFDESEEGEDGLSSALIDRLAFHGRIDAISSSVAEALHLPDKEAIAPARRLLPLIQAPTDIVERFCKAAAAFGIASLRASLLAVRAARALAALAGRTLLSEDDIGMAAALVLAPRATQVPATDSEPEQPQDSSPPDGAHNEQPQTEQRQQDRPLDDVILDAMKAVLPEELLASLIKQTQVPGRQSGGAGASAKAAKRGRPIGAKRGEIGHGNRIALLDTLRAAAPWQRLRQKDRERDGLLIQREDIRIRRFKQQAETTTIFVVDASGSAALHRLAEAKGAIELLLADCYVRRDSVQMIAFRGEKAETILPVTRSLVRAKRSLSGLPGGGGTPVASAIDAAQLAIRDVRRRGHTPLVVMLSDGKANIARNGTADRSLAQQDALSSASSFASSGVSAIFIDTSARPQLLARELAAAMRARYLPLPQADARRVVVAVKETATAAAR